MTMPRLPLATVKTCDGSVRVHPGSAVGFDPQPDPPAAWFTIVPKLKH